MRAVIVGRPVLGPGIGVLAMTATTTAIAAVAEMHEQHAADPQDPEPMHGGEIEHGSLLEAIPRMADGNWWVSARRPDNRSCEDVGGLGWLGTAAAGGHLRASPPS
jgi:hypothetical protein